MYHLGMDGLDIVLMASIREKAIFNYISLGSFFFLLSYSDLWLEVSVPSNFGRQQLYCDQCLEYPYSATPDFEHLGPVCSAQSFDGTASVLKYMYM